MEVITQSCNRGRRHHDPSHQEDVAMLKKTYIEMDLFTTHTCTNRKFKSEDDQIKDVMTDGVASLTQARARWWKRCQYPRATGEEFPPDIIDGGDLGLSSLFTS